MRWPRLRNRAKVLGINRRNLEYIFERNPRALFPRVDDKLLTKKILDDAGYPTPALITAVTDRTGIKAGLERLRDRNAAVVKPARGFGGQGVWVLGPATEGRGWCHPGGERVSEADMAFHLTAILSGMYSLDHLSDRALCEERVRDAPALLALHGGAGTADLRVIVADSRPAMAMLRLPCARSGGVANLHGGGVGAGVDLASGRTTYAIQNDRPIELHPDTQRELRGFAVPGWTRVLELCRPLNELFGLGYLGIDLLLDARRGPLLLEVNARPGLAIQLANRRGLREALERGEGTCE